MKDILNWIITNYRLVLEVAILIISVIVFILRKRPFVDVLHYVSLCLPDCINAAEKSGLKGQDKLYYALRQVIDTCANAYNLKINYRDYGQILLMIEDILSTPQKKGVGNEKKTHD